MRKSDVTRQLIIEKTAPVFNRKGYAGTSLNDLTMATGLTKGSIYGNFSGKDEVALAAFEYNLAQITTTVAQEAAAATTATGKLLAYVESYSALFGTISATGGCPILNTSVEADDTHPALRKKASDAIRSWKKQLERIINNGMETGELRNDIIPEHTAITMIAIIEGAIMIARVCNNNNYFSTAMQQVKLMIANLEQSGTQPIKKNK
ncbi:TetR/AcrR family transcriptional regulator [Parasegetibacter sp. NRK P23]|uniref:TetR/AcrR family transcriptional regulator n=1 Tax=Parasegetibacter sp. NRK P23 TaxID=2942999 RepID=UPI002043A8D9|nr:TetR/AcrR family transcriptional regulator [Parasegetibacter sp. NRK P23]MCM5528698.1 TetR/AcrR family transcriptional regulator [Parasegetibacter sp. NRK P23]